MKIILIDNYDSFTFNLYHYLSSFSKVEVFRNDKVDHHFILKKRYNKIVISPGPGNPNQSGNCLKIVKNLYKKIPILGSKIIQAKELVHGKTSNIINKKIGILNNLPKNFTATRYHSLVIDRKSLSKDLKITSSTSDGTIMGVMHKEYKIHGVQFHPESIKTKYGLKILENFVKE